MNHQIQFRTSYSQFYILDKNSPQATDSNEFWTDEAHKCKLAIEKGVLGVGIQTYSYVKAQIELLDVRPNNPNFDLYDNVVEGSIEIKSGVLQIIDCPNSHVEFELAVEPGFYRTLICSYNLGSVIDEDQEADDFYLIKIWLEEASPREIIKLYNM